MSQPKPTCPAYEECRRRNKQKKEQKAPAKFSCCCEKCMCYMCADRNIKPAIEQAKAMPIKEELEMEEKFKKVKKDQIKPIKKPSCECQRCMCYLCSDPKIPPSLVQKPAMSIRDEQLIFCRGPCNVNRVKKKYS